MPHHIAHAPRRLNYTTTMATPDEALNDRKDAPAPRVRLEPAPLHPERLTWLVLLARWTEFAKSAVALPEDADGRRMRDSVADVIMLQAVWFALQHLHELSGPERALGLDRAHVLIEKHEAAIRARWATVPNGIEELIGDAKRQLAASEE